MSSPWGTPAFSMIGAPGATGSTGELGPTGPTGGPGIAIYNGAQIPANTGAEGDYFINTTRDIYQYSSGGWTGLFSPEAYFSSIKTNEIMTLASEFQSTMTISTMSTYTSTFRYTGAAETFAIPVGTTDITFDILGGGGANAGGGGAYLQGTYTVQAGDSNIGIYVGQGGQLANVALGARFIGSNYNLLGSGAAAAATSDSNSVGGGGGAASGIVFPNGSNAIVVAGGGGGYFFNEFVYQGGAGGSAFGFEPSAPSLRLLLRASNYSDQLTWLDESGNGNHATLTGAGVKNTAGNGIILDSSQAIELDDLALGATWTLEAWYKQDSFDNSDTGASIISQQTLLEDNANFRYLGNVGAQKSVSAGFYTQGAFRQPTGVSLDRVWTHYTGTWDGSNMKIYKNSVLQNTTPVAFTAENRGARYVIGADYTGNAQMVGEIGEIRAYNYAINQAKVTADYNESLATFPNPNPISTYSFTIILPEFDYNAVINVEYDARVGYNFNTNSISGDESKVYSVGAFTGKLTGFSETVAEFRTSNTTFYSESIINATDPTAGIFSFRMQPPQSFLNAVNSRLYGMDGASTYTDPATCYFSFRFVDTNFVDAALYGISTNNLGVVNFPATVSNLTVPPPSAITGLAVADGTIATTGFDITWSGGRGLGVTTTFTLNGTAATAASAAAPGTASFTGLTPDTEYIVQVIATNSGGSVNSSITLTTPMSPPSEITGLVESEVTETSFVISWSGGTGTGVTTFISLNGTLTTPSSSGTGTATFTGLTAGTAYYVDVSVANSGGSVSSNITVTTSTPPPPPTPTAITGLTESDVTSSGFTVTWSGGTGTGVTTTFNLDGVLTTPSSSGTGTATFTGLTAEITFLVQVIATNSGGSVDSSIMVTTTA